MAKAKIRFRWAFAGVGYEVRRGTRDSHGGHLSASLSARFTRKIVLNGCGRPTTLHCRFAGELIGEL